jgi:hypothetical protein
MPLLDEDEDELEELELLLELLELLDDELEDEELELVPLTVTVKPCGVCAPQLLV